MFTQGLTALVADEKQLNNLNELINMLAIQGTISGFDDGEPNPNSIVGTISTTELRERIEPSLNEAKVVDDEGRLAQRLNEKDHAVINNLKSTRGNKGKLLGRKKLSKDGNALKEIIDEVYSDINPMEAIAETSEGSNPSTPQQQPSTTTEVVACFSALETKLIDQPQNSAPSDPVSVPRKIKHRKPSTTRTLSERSSVLTGNPYTLMPNLAGNPVTTTATQQTITALSTARSMSFKD